MSKNKKEINPSEKIIAIQQEICGLKKDTANPFFKSTYMDLASIVNTLKPILYSHDCYSTHKVGLDENARPFLKTEICYKDGSVLLDCKSPLPVKDATDPQKLGSAITYMRRYNLTALLEIEEDDDDGNRASNNNPSLANVAQGAKQDMDSLVKGEKEAKAAKKAKAEEYFRKLKQDIENAGSPEEIDGILEKEGSAIEKLKTGYKTIYNHLMSCVNDMKQIMNPDEEGEHEHNIHHVESK